MTITEETLETLYTPNKKEQITKIMYWVEHDLVNPAEILRCCLDLMSADAVDNLVALVEPELEDVEPEEDMSWYIEELLEKMGYKAPNPATEVPGKETFGGFQF